MTVMGNKLGKNNTYVVSGGPSGRTKTKSKMMSAGGGHRQDRRHSEDDSSSIAASDDLNYSGAGTWLQWSHRDTNLENSAAVAP